MLILLMKALELLEEKDKPDSSGKFVGGRAAYEAAHFSTDCRWYSLRVYQAGGEPLATVQITEENGLIVSRADRLPLDATADGLTCTTAEGVIVKVDDRQRVQFFERGQQVRTLTSRPLAPNPQAAALLKQEKNLGVEL